MTLIAIDPGLSRSGVATFDDGQLTNAFAVVHQRCLDPGAAAVLAAYGIENTALEHYGLGAITDVAGEWPRTYAPGRGGGPSAKLFPLAGILVGVACLLEAPLSTYTAREWSRGTKKTRSGDGRKSHRGRWLVAQLTNDELEVWDALPAKNNHDIVDAIGVGLHHLDRLSALPTLEVR